MKFQQTQDLSSHYPSSNRDSGAHITFIDVFLFIFNISFSTRVCHLRLTELTRQFDATLNSMLVFRMKLIIPAQWQWGLLFLVVGLCGYAAQVSRVVHSVTLPFQQNTRRFALSWASKGKRRLVGCSPCTRRQVKHGKKFTVCMPVRFDMLLADHLLDDLGALNLPCIPFIPVNLRNWYYIE